MKNLVAFMAKALVDNPEEVSIREHERGDILVFELRLAREDIGKVIGKGGNTIRAIRRIVKAAAFGRTKQVIVQVAG